MWTSGNSPSKRSWEVFSVYAVLKGAGMPDSASIAAAAMSALTSAGALTQDGKK